MLFLNQTDGVLVLPIGRGIRFAPKGTAEVPDGYSRPRRADNGSRRPSVVEELAGSDGGSDASKHKLVPADPAERVAWLQAPALHKGGPKETSMPTVEGYLAAGVPREKAEHLVRQAHQAIIDALGDGGTDTNVRPIKDKR